MNLSTVNLNIDEVVPYFYKNKIKKKNLIVFPTEEQAKKFYNDFSILESNCFHLPCWDTLTYDSFIPSLSIQGKRLNILSRLMKKNEINIVSSIKALAQKIYIEELEVIELEQLQEVDFDYFIENLIHLGYANKDRVESPASFSIRGGQVDIFPINRDEPIRIIFDGDIISEIKVFNIINQRSSTQLKSAIIVPASELYKLDKNDYKNIASSKNLENFDEYFKFQFIQNLPSYYSIFDLIDDSVEISIVNYSSCKSELSDLQKIEEESFANLKDFLTINIEEFSSRYLDIFQNLSSYELDLIETGDLSEIKSKVEYLEGLNIETVIKKLQNIDKKFLYTKSNEIRKKFSELENIKFVDNPFNYSAIFQSFNIAIVNDSIFNIRQQKRTVNKAKTISNESILVPNTFIVHMFHGVGLYEGTEVKKIKGVEKDYLSIKFAGSDRLFVPSEQINQLEVYVGGEHPKLSHLGGGEWERAKEKARNNAKVIADRVLNLYKQRNITNNDLIINPDTPWQKEIEDSFEFVETPDQLKAIKDVKADLEKNVPMDRLIFGDVGYGKTEVALRAAIKVAFSGGQVALLAPTTILVQQHVDTFIERLKEYPLSIEHLSRFVNKKKIVDVISGLENGTIDIVIGTHRLLSKDIKFQNLKLIIIDEEHRFGVEDKDKLHNLSNQLHKLTLTATPIPRTLEQSLMGIRETSRIETPPENRLDTLTHVGHVDEPSIALAIQREFSRGGQIFFVLNRIDQLQEWMKKIKDKFPNLKFGLLHGQLPTNQIEDIMQKVWDGKIDILFATTIVEAGIDLPKVNTLITVNSELLGMSQLYQLKGRVGRRGEQSFAYFFHSKNLSVDAEMRLYAIRSIGETSTGYSLAMKDLQLRGSGSILGDIQSGFIANVGLNIFNKYVLEAIERKTEKQISSPSNDLKLDTFWGASLPKSYINADSERLDIYKRLERSSTVEADLIYEELHDRFGEVPLVSKNLITTAKIRNILKQKNILKTIIKENSIEIFPIDLTESINTKLKEIDKKFIFRNKRLVLNFKIALTPNNTYEVIRSIL